MFTKFISNQIVEKNQVFLAIHKVITLNIEILV